MASNKITKVYADRNWRGNVPSFYDFANELAVAELINELGDVPLSQDQISTMFNKLRKDDGVAAQYRDMVEEFNEAWRVDMNRFGAYSSMYTLTDRILTNQEVEVVAIDDKSNEAPAQTDGKTIQFNFAQINGEFGSDEFLLGLHGLNHHEVAHLLWTPRKGSALIRWALESRLIKAFNLLEDNRIESLMVAKYPSTRAFLTASALNQIVNHPSNAGSRAYLFPLLCGRKYLDVSLRQDLASLFSAVAGAPLTRTVQLIVDQYVSLVLPRDEALAKDLILQFATALDVWDDADNDGEPDPHENSRGDNYKQGCSERSPMTSGRLEGTKAQQEVSDKAQGQGEDIDLSDEALQIESEDVKAEGDKLASKAGEQLSEVSNQQEVTAEIQQTRKSLRNSRGSVHTLSKTVGSDNRVTDQMRITAKQFSDELIQAEIDADPTWVTEQPSGRLNLQRAIRGDINSINTLFDRWSFTDQSTEIEAAILIDNSGSMSWQMEETNQAAWVIKRAVESIDGKVSTFTFSTVCKRLYDRDERAMPTVYRSVRAQSSTNPLSALIETSLVMHSSTAPNKLVFILTDGSWDNSYESDAEIKAMQEGGVTVVVVFMTTRPSRWDIDTQTRVYGPKEPKTEFTRYAHGADVFEVVYEPRELINVARSAVTEVLAKQAA